MWYYIYKHTNKINNKSYIGKTENPENRWSNNGIKYKTCPRFWSAIVSYGWDNFTHEILFKSDNIDIINQKEKEYIIKYNTLNPKYGYNLAEGGTGGNTWIGKTQEEKDKYAEERRKETLSRGIEWHKRLSEAQTKRWTSEDGERLKIKQHEKMLSGNNPMAKKCKCIELNKTFDSYADAAEYIGRKRSSGSKIGEVIRGNRSTFGGYHWGSV